MDAFGLADQIKAIEPTGIWPENALTVRVFFDLEYQWREIMTSDGLIQQGLDHGQIKHTLDLLRVKRRDWLGIFNGLKVMETEALKIMRGDA
ncbi:MAG: hypothetical protein A2Y38_05650 [Spirochaetes bacterium GWB1_59_5]|nr:MAG: hypothetical protein A2Y38_05650 [Spirochaetes bacterium GWB1_59_5]